MVHGRAGETPGPGRPLAALLEARELDAATVLPLLGHVADALDAAHAAGLVHGDLGPGSVMVEQGGRAQLGDFGFGATTGSEAVAGTPAAAPDAVAGTPASAPEASSATPAYAAPEVIAGGPPTSASDLYAFAAIVFECLSGEAVFPRATEAAVLQAHATEPPPKIGRRRRGLPASLDRILLDALAKDPDARPGSARALIDSVTKALGPGLIPMLGAPPPPRPPSGASAAPAQPPAPRAPKPARPRRRKGRSRPGRRPALLALTLGGAAVAVAGALVILLGGGDESGDPSRGAKQAVVSDEPPPVAEQEPPPGAGAAGGGAGSAPVGAGTALAGATAAPPRWSGAYARQTRRWSERARVRVGTHRGRPVDVVLVDWHLRVAVDLYAGATLLERVAVPAVRPRGRVVDLSRAPGAAAGRVIGRVNVSYVGGGTVKPAEHVYQVSRTGHAGPPTMTFVR